MTMIKLNLGTPPQQQLDSSSYVDNTPSHDERWLELWDGSLRTENVESVRKLAKKLKPNCKNLIVIGMGGSSLGVKAIQQSILGLNWNLLDPNKRNGPRLFVLDNIDPTTVQSTYDLVKCSDPDLQHTVVCVISKSGDTLETITEYSGQEQVEKK